MFGEIIKKIVDNKNNHNNGYYNCIPFMGMESLEEYLPGIEHSTFYLLAANSGIGKSKLARYLFIHNPMMFLEQDLKDNPESTLKLNVLYFSLEESKEKIILSEIAKYLHTKYGITVSIKDIISVGKYNTISEDIIEKIKEAELYVNKFLENVTIYDSIRNPTGIFKTVRDFALKVGTYYDVNNNPLTSNEVENVRLGKGEDYKKISYYKKYNDRHFVIVLIDHVGLLQLELGETLHQTIGKMSSNYCLHMRDKFGFTPVIVQQMASDKEKIETNFQGKTNEEKLEPSLDSLGNNRETSRDVNIAIGLFSPARYKIENHNGYNILKLANNYRSLNIMKSRDGIADKKIGLFFNGAVDHFKEMPDPKNLELMQQVYSYIDKLNKKP